MDFEEIKRKDEIKELNDFEQKIITNNNNNEKTFEIYGLLNDEWIEKYKNKFNYNLQKLQFNNNFSDNIFKVSDLLPKFENLELEYGEEKIRINFPNNFSLVSKKFINLITKNFEIEEERNRILNLCYEGYRTKKGLYIKDNKENMVLYYRFFSENNRFKIKFILKYSEEIFMNKELKMIHQQGFNDYKIKRNIKSPKQAIYDDNGEKIGYIYFYLSPNQIHNNNLKMNYNNRNNIYEDTTKDNLYLLNNSKLNSIFLCLYQIEDLKQGALVNNVINQNEAIRTLNEFLKQFQILKKDSFNKIHSIFNFKSEVPRYYKKIISMIFNKLNPEKNLENKNALENQFNQANQYDEKGGKELFLRNNKKDSIIQNLFYCIKEKKISCLNCGLNVYKFTCFPFISIAKKKKKKKRKIQDIIFEDINRKDKMECNFCSGITTNCNIISKIIDFPKILIIILENDYILEFNLNDNLYIINDNISYSLICFIENAHDHNVYFKKDNNWSKYDKNYDEQKIVTLNNIKPIVLFYELEKNNIDNHISSYNKNNLNININNNFNNNNANNIINNSNNTSDNSNRQNFMPNTMNNMFHNNMIINKANILANINGCMYPNNINQNNMKKFDNVNLMNNSNSNFQKYNINNINNINNNFYNQQNITNNFNMNNSNNIILNNKNNINNNKNQRSQSFYNNKNNYMNNIFNRDNNNLNFNMNKNMNFNMMSNNMNNNIYNSLNNNMKNNINNNMNNQFNINNNVNINNNGNMNGNAINNILNNNHNNNMMCRSMDFKMMKNKNNNGFNNNMINMANTNINYNWNNNNNHMINSITNNIHVINNMNGGNIFNANNNSNNPGNNTNNNNNNESGHNNHNKQITNKSNNNNPNNQNLQSKNHNNKKNNNNNLIFLTFTFKKYNKQIFIDVLDNILFSQVIKELEDKYAWLKKIKKKLYYFEGIELNENKNIKEYGIKDNSDITVII